MVETLPTIGILGAGKLGVVLGQLARKAGYKVYIAGSGDHRKISLATKVLIPGAVAMTNAEVARLSDIVILALPLSKFRTIPKEELKDKLVIDAMNYWWEVDGPRSDFMRDDQSSSQAVQDFLNESRVVKALNHMGYHNLHDHTKPKGQPDRRAIAIAGNNPMDVKVVESLVDDLGFDPLVIGGLEEGSKLEAGTKAFGASVGRDELVRLIG